MITILVPTEEPPDPYGAKSIGEVPTAGCINPLSRRKSFPQGLKPAILLALFGTTEVVPFQNTLYATSSINTAVAAVTNAVYHAIGNRFRKHPVRPEDAPQTLIERAASRAAE